MEIHLEECAVFEFVVEQTSYGVLLQTLVIQHTTYIDCVACTILYVVCRQPERHYLVHDYIIGAFFHKKTPVYSVVFNPGYILGSLGIMNILILLSHLKIMISDSETGLGHSFLWKLPWWSDGASTLRTRHFSLGGEHKNYVAYVSLWTDIPLGTCWSCRTGLVVVWFSPGQLRSCGIASQTTGFLSSVLFALWGEKKCNHG